jgi:hypothetical protein
MIHNDLLVSKDVQFSNSVTNLVESGIEVVDFITQLRLISRGVTVARGDAVYAAFDIPMSEGGLLQCKWTYAPFKEGPSTVFAGQSNCWTPPGAVTFPHTDDFACGMYIIHLDGRKCWIVAPGTPKNLALVEFTRTGDADMTSTLDVILGLEDMHVLYLTDDEYQEHAFYLRPGTIHCCISITESCHAGRPVRSVDFGFLDDVEVAYKSAIDWLLLRLIPLEVASEEAELRKVTCVKSVAESLLHWASIWVSLHDGQAKRRLRSILVATQTGLEKAAGILGISLEELSTTSFDFTVCK